MPQQQHRRALAAPFRANPEPQLQHIAKLPLPMPPHPPTQAAPQFPQPLPHNDPQPVLYVDWAISISTSWRIRLIILPFGRPRNAFSQRSDLA